MNKNNHITRRCNGLFLKYFFCAWQATLAQKKYFKNNR